MTKRPTREDVLAIVRRVHDSALYESFKTRQVRGLSASEHKINTDDGLRDLWGALEDYLGVPRPQLAGKETV